MKHYSDQWETEAAISIKEVSWSKIKYGIPMDKHIGYLYLTNKTEREGIWGIEISLAKTHRWLTYKRSSVMIGVMTIQ